LRRSWSDSKLLTISVLPFWNFFPISKKKATKVSSFIHPSADVSPQASIGDDTKIWQIVQVREGAQIGTECIIGRGVYIDAHVKIGNRVKIQNYVSIYEGVTIENGVFVGPHVVFTNDKLPRAVNPDGSLKSPTDWTITPTFVKEGAALGANSTIVCGLTIGSWALVGSGTVVTRDVPDYGLVVGNPARLIGYVCKCGHRLAEGVNPHEYVCDHQR
jgi:acetyltransferase-like isoleucine patch superfamily enzyme